MNTDEFHVWHIDIPVLKKQLYSLQELLSKDEIDRSNKFHFEKDRHKFTIVRGMLRKILASYLFINPQSIEFQYNEYGKPFLESMPLHFNVSHSADFALCIVGSHFPVGIDIEHVHPIDDIEDIAAQFFSSNEFLKLKSLPEREKVPAFYRCWTRKEAFIKAIGNGLSYPLNEFEVSLLPDEAAKIYSVQGSEAQASRWSLLSVSAPEGYEAACVIEGNSKKLVYHSSISCTHPVGQQIVEQLF